MTNHSFVIRVWLEEPPNEKTKPKWRGHITHFPSKLDKYFDDFVVINTFIQSCLALENGEGWPEQEPS
jgi:hypothetical protein